MKKVLIFLVVLMAVPAMAVNVSVTATDNGDKSATITVTTDANLIRGFGLDLSVDAGTITAVTPTPGGEYRIFPGQIYVVDGNVVDYNTPYVPGSLPAAAVTVEMASLYTDDAAYAGDPNYGYGLQPSMTEIVMVVTTSDCGTLSIAENAARGGVVLEDPDLIPVVTLTGDTITGCGPACWDYSRHCYGDTDGDNDVDIDDFYPFKDSYDTVDGVDADYNPCADFDSDGDVDIDDFYPFKDNYDSIPPVCP